MDGNICKADASPPIPNFPTTESFFSMQPKEEQDLLKALQAGDPAAKDRFLREFAPTIEAISRWPRWGIPLSEREDLKQHLLLRVFTEVTTFNGSCPLEAFVVRTCISRGYDFLRKWIRRQGPLATSLPGGDDPATWLDKQTPEIDPAREGAVRRHFDGLPFAIIGRGVDAHRDLRVRRAGETLLSEPLSELKRLWKHGLTPFY